MIHETREALARLYAEEYLEKVFYFCLRKTGDPTEAEDLSSDVTVNILAALSSGTVPRNFPAWVWAVAQNRWNRWAREREKRRERFGAGPCESAPEGISDEDTPEEALLRREEASLLRRELAFIASDYRKIVVAYYLEDRKVKDIAAMLGMPEGTVKAKLFRARNILKEGMTMAREFGILSYKPENVEFETYGWEHTLFSLDHLLTRNILLAAYRTPSSAQELSVELGVALPYMEEELARLTEASLTRLCDGKYETNVFIVSRNAQRAISGDLQRITPALFEAVADAVEYELGCWRENGRRWHTGTQTEEEIRWTLLMMKMFWLKYSALNNGDELHKPTRRPDGGAWDVIGWEAGGVEKPSYVSHWRTGLNRHRGMLGEFERYVFDVPGIEYSRSVLEDFWLDDGEAAIVHSVIDGKTPDAPPALPALLEKLARAGYIELTPAGPRPALLVLLGDGMTLTPAQEEVVKQKAEAIRAMVRRHAEFIRETIIGEAREALKNDEHQIGLCCFELSRFNGALLGEALARGWLDASRVRADRLGLFTIL